MDAAWQLKNAFFRKYCAGCLFSVFLLTCLLFLMPWLVSPLIVGFMWLLVWILSFMFLVIVAARWWSALFGVLSVSFLLAILGIGFYGGLSRRSQFHGVTFFQMMALILWILSNVSVLVGLADACFSANRSILYLKFFLKICRKCGYDLRGLPERRCPECGTVF